MCKWVSFLIFLIPLISCSFQDQKDNLLQGRSLFIEIDDPSIHSPHLYIGNHIWSENKLWFSTNFSEVISVDTTGKIHERINLGKVEIDPTGMPVEYKGGVVTDFLIGDSDIYALYLANDQLKKLGPGKKQSVAINLPSKEDLFFLNFRGIAPSNSPDSKTLFVLSGVSGDFDSYDLNFKTHETKPLFKGKFVPDVRSFEVTKSPSGNYILFDLGWNGIMIFDPSGVKIFDFKMPQNSAELHQSGKEDFEKWFRLGFEELGARIINVVGEPEDLWVLVNLNPSGKANGPSDPFFILRKNKSEWDFFKIKGIDQIDINDEGLVLITNLKNKKVVFEIMEFDHFISRLDYSKN